MARLVRFFFLLEPNSAFSIKPSLIAKLIEIFFNLKPAPEVPALLEQCIEEVEKRGMNDQYLYSQGGRSADIAKLEKKFDRGKSAPDLSKELIATITSTIKNFLRSIKGYLIPIDRYNYFLQATTVKNKEESKAAVRLAITKLPRLNRNILAYLMLHLQLVSKHAKNEMNIRNLGTVFGPTVVVDVGEDSSATDRIAVSAFGSSTLIF